MKTNLITFHCHDIMKHANPHCILMFWYFQNTVKGMSEMSIFEERVQTDLTVQTQLCLSSQLFMKIFITCILMYFAVNLSVAWLLFIRIFFNESSLQIITDIYHNS